LIGLPPVIAAFRSIANPHRLRVFIISWLLSLPLLFVMLFGDKFLFGDQYFVPQNASLLGIPWIVLITDLTALALLLLYGLRYWKYEQSTKEVS
jgi:hypothetical protein